MSTAGVLDASVVFILLAEAIVVDALRADGDYVFPV